MVFLEDDASTEVDLFLYLGIYAMFGLLQTFFVLGFVLSMLYASIQASAQIHKYGAIRFVL